MPSPFYGFGRSTHLKVGAGGCSRRVLLWLWLARACCSYIRARARFLAWFARVAAAPRPLGSFGAQSSPAECRQTRPHASAVAAAVACFLSRKPRASPRLRLPLTAVGH